MTKNVQVYFHTDDEAEKLRAKLSKFSTNNVIVDYLEEDSDNQLVVPYLPNTTSGGNTESTGVSSHAVGFKEINKDEKIRDTVLSFDVAEEDLNDVLVEIQKIGGHVDRALFD